MDAQKFKSITIKGEGNENNQKQNKLVKEYYQSPANSPDST
jgi:hypothetical protein